MRKILFVIAAFIFASSPSNAADWAAAEIVTIKDCYTQSVERPCESRDAIFFVHGIFGDVETFTNGSYRWPEELAADFPDVDVFVIKYRTQLLNWLDSDVATFDEIAEVLMSKMQGPVVNDGGSRVLPDGFVTRRNYRSVGFIAHSLGGNVTAAYLHSVKSELGHSARAQNAYIITLGTPAEGSYLANVGLIMKRFLHLNDPLLTSMERDNLFLRMLAMWRRAEDQKSQRFNCRPVHLYVGIEGASVYGIPVVSEQSAKEPYERLAKKIKVFSTYDHFRIAAPDGKIDPLNVWVTDIIKDERKRMDEWKQPLCGSETGLLPQ
jgi:hypothetical protein